MKTHPSNRENYDPERYLKDVGDRFTLANRVYRPKSYDEEQQSHQLKKIWKNFREHWAAIVVNVLTLVAVIFYTHYARLQWCEMKKATEKTGIAANAAMISARVARESLDSSDHNFRIQERPYVVVKIVKFDEPLEANKEIGLSVIVDNSGHTPALKVTYAGNLYIGTVAAGKIIAGEGESVIGSQIPTIKHYILEFSTDDLDRISANSPLKVKGTIQYTDIFDEPHAPPHFTSYCFMYDKKPKIFKFCPLGNDVR